MKTKLLLILPMLAAGAFHIKAQTISLEHTSTYHTGVFAEGAAEIVTYDKTSQKLFFSNADANSVGILDFSDPASLTLEMEIDMSPYGDGVNSVSAYNGIVAVAVEGDGTLVPGKVVFFEADGTYLNEVTVGYLPDMLTFSHDGSKVVVPCEGEPGDDWTEDPAGSVSVIDVSGGVASVTQANVTDIRIGDYSGSWGDARFFGPSVLPAWEDDFQQEDTINFDTVFVHWTQHNIQGGSRQWHEYEFPTGSGKIFARISGYDGGCQDNEDYLVSETFDLSTFDAASLSFSSAFNFTGPGLELLVSTDFDGTNVLAATWDTLTGDAMWPATGSYTWQQSGEVDLGDYLENEVTVAFLYRSDASGCSTWEFDSVIVNGTHSAASNVEPEYVAISEDNATAFVTLQENNAVAVINLANNTITEIHPLGYKDHSVAGNGLDAGDDDGVINITTYPFLGMYLPDAIASYTVGGSTYYVTANEGDTRDYDAYSEEERLEDVTLDPTAFPNAATLQTDAAAGRIKLTSSMGDTDADGDYDEVYTFGARSFSIWSAAGSLVYDSGDDFEQTMATDYPNDFNSTNDENGSFDNRSDDKGPEPEAVEIARINGEYYAFVGLERMGGVMVYNINTPASPVFVEYINNRDFSADAETEQAGDLGCEDVLFIDGQDSPDQKFYIVTSNEVSGTVSVFEITGAVGIEETKINHDWSLYPNPASDLVNLGVKDNYTVTDISGRIVLSVAGENMLDVQTLNKGVYTVSNSAGDTKILIRN